MPATNLELKLKAVQIRKNLLTMIHRAKAGHTGGSLSNTDILTALYYRIMKLDVSNPRWADRDRFIASKGHSVESLWCILADKGFFPKEELETFSQFGTRLIGHPNNKVPGIEMNTGALAAYLEQLLRLRLDALGRVDQHDCAVRRRQRAVRILGEVLVAGRIENVHPMAVIVELHNARGHGDPSLLLDLHPVARGVPVGLAPFDRTGQANGSPEQQQLFG